MNELRPKARSWAIASSTPYVDRACVPSTGTAMCADVVSVHARSGVGRHAAAACAIVVKKVVAEGMAWPGVAVAVRGGDVDRIQAGHRRRGRPRENDCSGGGVVPVPGKRMRLPVAPRPTERARDAEGITQIVRLLLAAPTPIETGAREPQSALLCARAPGRGGRDVVRDPHARRSRGREIGLRQDTCGLHQHAEADDASTAAIGRAAGGGHGQRRVRLDRERGTQWGALWLASARQSGVGGPEAIARPALFLRRVTFSGTGRDRQSQCAFLLNGHYSSNERPSFSDPPASVTRLDAMSRPHCEHDRECRETIPAATTFFTTMARRRPGSRSAPVLAWTETTYLRAWPCRLKERKLDGRTAWTRRLRMTAPLASTHSWSPPRSATSVTEGQPGKCRVPKPLQYTVRSIWPAGVGGLSPFTDVKSLGGLTTMDPAVAPSSSVPVWRGGVMYPREVGTVRGKIPHRLLP